MTHFIRLTLILLAIYVAATVIPISNYMITIVCAQEHSSDNEVSGHSHNQGPTSTDDNKVVLTDKAKANIGLKTAEADLRTIERIVQVTGNIIPHPTKQVIVTPRIGGIVINIHYKLGDTVKKGDVLLELESIDLQLAEIDLIEAAHQQKSLVLKSAKQKSVFAKQIRLELTTRQIDYLESLEELQEQKSAYQKHRSLAITKTISVLEQMRFDLIRAAVERDLLENTLRRIESLTEKRISAQKELVANKAAYRKAIISFNHAKRQFQILGVSSQALQNILDDDGQTFALNLLEKDSMTKDSKVMRTIQIEENGHPALQFVTLIEEAAGLVNSETAYKHAVHKAHANRQQALATGLSESHLDKLADTGKIESFNNLTTDELIEHYAPFMTSSETLAALLQTEEAQRNAAIVLEKVRRKLEVFGITEKEIDRIVETGKSHPLYYVRATGTGQIIKQDVIIGTTVEKSDSLYTILDSDVVWVEGEAYEDTLATLHDKWQIGSKVRIRVPSYPGEVFSGKIAQISTVVDPEKRTVHFWTEVENPNNQLKTGMFAKKTLVIEEIDDVLSVPLTAVLDDGAKKVVFVESSNTYIKHEVNVGVKDDRYIEIKDGLFAGELVVIQGTHQLMRETAGSTKVIDPHAGHDH